jgi:hypothetical protein
MESPAAFGKFYKGDSWNSWKVFLRAISGLPITDPKDMKLFRQCTGRQAPFPAGHRESYAVCGRRSGKSKVAALVACHNAIFGNWEEKVGLDEKWWIFVISYDLSQSTNVFNYIKSMLTASFPDAIERETQDTLVLKNGCCITTKAAAPKSTRGYSIAVVILDECAAARDDNSANPIDELVISLMPALLPGGVLLGISSPLGKMGYLWDTYHSYHGKEESEILVWQAATRTMNDTYDQNFIDKLLRRKRTQYTAEYMATFRDDITAFMPEELVEKYCIGFEQPSREGFRYTAFVDMSGARHDSAALGIAHCENERVHLDLVREIAGEYNTIDACAEFAAIAKGYGVREIVADHYGGAFPSDQFNKSGVMVQYTDLPKSEIYLELHARMRSGQCVLLDDDRLKVQLRNLVRKQKAGGRAEVDHQQGGMDDVANVAAGAIIYATRGMNAVWSEEKIASRLPRSTGHLSPRGTLIAEEQRKADQRRDNSEIMHDWMTSTGCTPAGVPRRPKRPWEV